MTEPSKAQTIDGELPRHCAYTLPGVVLALGAEHWSLLKDTYELLSTDMQVIVVSYKLHRMIYIITYNSGYLSSGFLYNELVRKLSFSFMFVATKI